MRKPINDADEICPFHKRDVRKVCHHCPLYILLRGKNPQSNEEIDEWGCALAFMPVLMIEGTQMARQTSSAIESFRNKMVEQNERLLDNEAGRLING